MDLSRVIREQRDTARQDALEQAATLAESLFKNRRVWSAIRQETGEMIAEEIRLLKKESQK